MPSAKKQPSRQKVLILVDWENIRRSVGQFCIDKADPSIMAGALVQLVDRELGEFRGGVVFGDWSRRALDPRAFSEHNFRAEHVQVKWSGQDRTDIRIHNHVRDMLERKEDVDVFLLCSGDADFADTVQVCVERGKKLYVAAVSASVGQELRSRAAAVFPLENYCGFTPRGAIDNDFVESLADLDPTELENWRPFILALDEAEQRFERVNRYPFVKRHLEQVGVGSTQQDRDELVTKAIDHDFVQEQVKPSPRNPRWKEHYLELNRQHLLVQAVLHGVEM